MPETRPIGRTHRTRILAVLAAAVLAVTGVAAVHTGEARAANAPYDRNMILANRVFDDVDAMGTAQIQAFIDRFPRSCLKNHTDRIPTGYSSYSGTGSAAQVIRAASKLWKVNPQVLLVTLEKEQSLITGGAGCDQWRYWSAMGYNCPDGGGRYDYPNLGITGTCVKREGDAGFAAQVNRGAWQLQFNRQRAEGNLEWNGSSSVHNYGFNTEGYRRAHAGAPSIYYDGWATISGQPVYMTNGATATLYTYTPHLSANRVFYDLFTNWFGSVAGGSGPTTTTRPPSTTAPPVPVGPDADYVDSVYRLFLGRRAGDGEKRMWIDYFDKGNSKRSFVARVLGSAEHTRSMVERHYRDLLGREPDSSGLASWTDALVRSGRDDTLSAGLAGSSEYYRNRARSDDLLFLGALYWDFLGRNVDAAGAETWTRRLSEGRISRTGVANAVLGSHEYARRTVAISYALVLGRWPDASGWEHWAADYQRHHRTRDLHTSLASSAEGYGFLSSIK